VNGKNADAEVYKVNAIFALRRLTVAGKQSVDDGNRWWRGPNDNVIVDGNFRSFKQNSVFIDNRAGDAVEVAIADLSKSDQEFVRQRWGEFDDKAKRISQQVASGATSNAGDNSTPHEKPARSRGVRTWTSDLGTEIQARLVSAAGASVTLENEEGKRLTVELERLSEVDQEYVREQFGKPTSGEKP
jgi:hypothetical protein